MLLKNVKKQKRDNDFQMEKLKKENIQIHDRNNQLKEYVKELQNMV